MWMLEVVASCFFVLSNNVLGVYVCKIYFKAGPNQLKKKKLK